MNPFSLEGKKILVTGASSGIGKAIAIECARMGAQLIITGRNKEKLQETLVHLNGTYHSMKVADLTSESDINQLLVGQQIFDGVVLSTGIQNRLPLKMINHEKLSSLMETNFIASALLVKSLYKNKLIADKASIVFISSIASGYASLGNIMYMASKGAMNSFMKGIALELAPSGIRANAIQPGMIKTNLSSALDDDTINKDMENYPLKRYGQPEEVAWATIYLLSDATRWMTGSILTIDGGLTLR